MAVERADTITGYLFCVFASPDSEPKALPDNPAYCFSHADAKWIENEFDSLYESVGIGITTSDDEVVSGDALQILRSFIEASLAKLAAKPSRWPEFLGLKGSEDGPPIHEDAQRERLTEFLLQALRVTDQAIECSGYVIWGGGE